MEKKTLVLDASVVVKWYGDESDTDRALAIRDLYRRHHVDVIVPELLFYEVVNAIRFNRTLTLSEKNEIIENLFSIEFSTSPPSKELLIDANRLAHDLNVTAYDTTYLALAKTVNGLYVTADDEFVRKARSKYVVALSEWGE